MMVHPAHQRKGIGRKLMQWGLDLADKEKIVAYLNARPAGFKMYQAAGYEIIGPLTVPLIEGDEGNLVPTGYAMLRMPRPRPDPVG